jgi:hypothetical protein
MLNAAGEHALTLLETLQLQPKGGTSSHRLGARETTRGVDGAGDGSTATAFTPSVCSARERDQDGAQDEGPAAHVANRYDQPGPGHRLDGSDHPAYPAR